jgi:hypothetical protein
MSSIAFSAPTTPAADSARETGSSKRSFAKVGLATVVAATLANGLVYFVGDAVVGYDPDFVVLANASGAVIFTVAAAVVAVLLYGVLLRWTTNPVPIFKVVSAVVFVVTAVPDFTYIPGVESASNGQTAVLVLMHVVAAAVIVGMLARLAAPRGRRI